MIMRFADTRMFFIVNSTIWDQIIQLVSQVSSGEGKDRIYGLRLSPYVESDDFYNHRRTSLIYLPCSPISGILIKIPVVNLSFGLTNSSYNQTIRLLATS
jgi:hypothetical protein